MSMQYCYVGKGKRVKMTGKHKLKMLAHQRWIAKMTQGKIADKKMLDKMWRAEYNESMMVDRSAFQKRGITAGACAKPDEKVYTGGNLLGIATMHKSNMVPIFKAEDAADIARMRRG